MGACKELFELFASASPVSNLCHTRRPLDLPGVTLPVAEAAEPASFALLFFPPNSDPNNPFFFLGTLVVLVGGFPKLVPPGVLAVAVVRADGVSIVVEV